MGNKEEWNQIISAKLKNGQTLDDLKTTYDSGIVVDPNVVSEEVSHLDHRIILSDPWINMAHIDAAEDTEINRLALLSLDQGANGLSIILPKGARIDTVLKGVLTEYLKVHFVCADWTTKEITEAQQNSSTYPNLTWFGEGHRTRVHIKESDRIASIKSALSSIRQETETDLVVSIGKDILFEVASLRALKILLQKHHKSMPTVVARYEVAGTNILGDYNLIERTYKVMSAIMGNADIVLTDYAGDEESRLALNIHNVLALESGFTRVHDPVGGAYYVEKLVEEIIKKAENI